MPTQSEASVSVLCALLQPQFYPTAPAALAATALLLVHGRLARLGLGLGLGVGVGLG